MLLLADKCIASLSFGFPYKEAPKTYIRKLTLAPSVEACLDGIGGGSGAFGQRFADADGVP